MKRGKDQTIRGVIVAENEANVETSSNNRILKIHQIFDFDVSAQHWLFPDSHLAISTNVCGKLAENWHAIQKEMAQHWELQAKGQHCSGVPAKVQVANTAMGLT